MSSPRIALLSVEPVETRTKLDAQIKLKITFEVYEELPDEVEWEIAMAWDGERTHDQVLDTVEVGPLQVGKHQFLFDASDPPDYSKVREEDVTDVAVLFLRCSYRGNMFSRVAFFVSHVYIDEKLRETPPEKPQLDMLERVISIEDVRVTNFQIKWTDQDNLMPPRKSAETRRKLSILAQPEDDGNKAKKSITINFVATLNLATKLSFSYDYRYYVSYPEVMTMYVFPPFFDLPSLDPVSLQFLAVSRFVASDIRVVPTAKPSDTPTGKLPCYVDNDVKISDFDEFVDYLRGAHREIVLDYELTQEQRSLCVAYSALIREKLVPALTLNLLSSKLGESKYIHGNKPSSLDALLYGYFAPLLKLPLANDKLQLQLSSQPNLCIFLENITSIYLPLSEEQIRESMEQRTEFTPVVDRARKTLEKQRNTEKIKKAEKQKADSDSAQSLVLFGVVSISLSFIFAVHFGIIKFVPQEKNS
ncbi:GST C-terminal domain-containing protein [Aphelenchoides besseyi]|nr:GST C-terminal domain-containing protein [Aphelenchoides besseyi]